MKMSTAKLINGDCLVCLQEIADKSVDLILTDLPYGTTNNKWDSIIDLDILWGEYRRVIKDAGAILLFGQGMFTAKLMTSNEKMHRYNLIWEKTRAGGFLNAKRMPLQAHEDIAVFYKNLPTYNPQFIEGKPFKGKGGSQDGSDSNYSAYGTHRNDNPGIRYPRSVIKFSNPNNNSLHPTQKPVELLEYLIKTYSNEGDTVLDSTMGVGSTGVAAIGLGRNFIGIELEKKYFDIATERMNNVLR